MERRGVKAPSFTTLTQRKHLFTEVKKESKKFKAHRVVAVPLETNKNITSNERGVTEDRSLAKRKGDISDKTVLQTGENDNTK